jgi:acyl-CoA reductase-like NAD-dependent aldehyde dehydrogenase
MEAAAQPRRRFHSRLEAIEASMDCRISRIEDNAREIKDTIKEMRADMKEMRAEMRSELDEVHNKIAGFKIALFTTAIGVVLGIASFNAAMTSNMLSAFQAGIQNVTQKTPIEEPEGPR